MDKNKCPYFDSSKKFLKFFLCFFHIFIFKNNNLNISILCNANVLEKEAQSIRKNWKKCDFLDTFPFFLIFFHFEK